MPFEAGQVQGGLSARGGLIPVARGRQDGRPGPRGGQGPEEGDAGLGVAGGRADLQGSQPLVRLLFVSGDSKGGRGGGVREKKLGWWRSETCGV